jgi:hypothetical protein
MAYNKEYYETRKANLTARFKANKDAFIREILRLSNKLVTDQADINNDLTAIMDMEKNIINEKPKDIQPIPRESVQVKIEPKTTEKEPVKKKPVK